MATELLKELVDAGIHYGHRASRWNPKMKPYIFGKRGLIHLHNVKETLKGILLARKFLSRVVADGKDILLVGTKRQARPSIESNAQRVGMHYVSDRWLGGTLTNFREIRKRIGRFDELERLEAEGMLDTYSKKEGSALRRELRKVRRNLQGIRKMDKMPGALVVIDQKREIISIREANKMGVPVVCLLDTDGDPDLVDIPIPGNDDAMRAIEVVVRELSDGIAEGVAARQDKQGPGEISQAGGARRTRRPTTARADEPADKPGAPAEPPVAPPDAGAPAVG